MRRENAVHTVEHAYRTYGAYVNGGRALPHINDGLKTVQRRLIVTAKDVGARNGMVHSPAISGTCVARYNPHGEGSSYDSMVRMINQAVPVFKGKGNFGFEGFVVTTAAAARYTSATLTEISSLFLDYVDYVPYFNNDLGNDEPCYLPTPFPYALLNGAAGVGVGTSCHIPRITTESLYRVARQILKGKENVDLDWLHPVPQKDGNLDIDEEELWSLCMLGEGRATLSASVHFEYSPVDGKEVIVITNVPKEISFSRLLAKLRDYMEEDLVSIRDESGDTIRVVVIRRSGVRRISEDELYDIVKKCMTRTVYYRINVCNDQNESRQIGLYEWLRHTLNLFLKAYEASAKHEHHKLRLEATFIRVRKELATMLLKDESKDKIMSKLDLNQEEYDYCLKKSIRQLSKSRNSDEEIQNRISKIEDKLQNLNKYADVEVLRRLKNA